MSKAVFIYRANSKYNDTPSVRYQFPKRYLKPVSACIGDWIIYYEPTKVRSTRGYFAVAKVAEVARDPSDDDMYFATIETGTYLDFGSPVPFQTSDGHVEQSVLNQQGGMSGRKQAAVRLVSVEDFNRIVDLGLRDDATFLPRDGVATAAGFAEVQLPYQPEIDRDRTAYLGSRLLRDRQFRQRVVTAYDSRCAMTGLKLINGMGRAEVEAAHIRPVERGGPDIVNNGLALSGTVHWMFDRGLISMASDLTILISRQANDPDGIRAMLNRDGRARPPFRPQDRPHPAFLDWHRAFCFKA